MPKPKLNKQDLINISILLQQYYNSVNCGNLFLNRILTNIFHELTMRLYRKITTVGPNGCSFKLKLYEKNAILYMRNHEQIFGSGESEKSIYTLLEIN
jgi:hypothetical protein